ncbi:MAG: hypothetical protein ISR01_06650 [Chitinophagales bacterium]|nr:hypothetical protein [Chitinophagales bacterium]
MKNLIPVFFMILLALSCNKDKCADLNCNFGTCVEGSCECDEGFEGDDCSVASNEKFLGDWELPCQGVIDIPVAGGSQEIPTQTTVITVDAGGNPDQISLEFTIPFINQDIVITGIVVGDEVVFDEQEFGIPGDVIEQLVGFPISLTIEISGTGTLTNDEMLVNLFIDGGALAQGEINCIGVRV